MIQDILTAIPLGIFLSFLIGPVFFVLLETSAVKGFRAALVFDLGVVFADIVFILIAYFSSYKLIESLKNDPSIFIFGGILMLTYGIISFIKLKKLKNEVSQEKIEIVFQKKNYRAFVHCINGFFLRKGKPLDRQIIGFRHYFYECQWCINHNQ